MYDGGKEQPRYRMQPLCEKPIEPHLRHGSPIYCEAATGFASQYLQCSHLPTAQDADLRPIRPLMYTRRCMLIDDHISPSTTTHT